VFDVRRRILRAARIEFAERGYAGATFEQIGRRVGLTRSAVNYHFSGKQALYREVRAQTEARVLEAEKRRRRPAGGTTLLAELTGLFTDAGAFEARSRSAVALMMVQILDAHRHPCLGTPAYVAATVSELTAAVQRAVHRGELGPDTDVPALVAMLTVLLCGIGFSAIVAADHDVEAVTDQMTRLLAGSLWQIRPSRDQRLST
jgi:AcrR family transcriptional regulator